MTKKFKVYKLCKVKKILKKYPILLINHTLNLNSKSWNIIEKKLINSNLKYYKLNNTLTKHTLTNSIFLNFKPILSGSLCFIYPKNVNNFESNFYELIKINKTMPTLALKLNRKIYSKNQLSTISTLNYNKNVGALNKTLKKILKTPYYKFKNSK